MTFIFIGKREKLRSRDRQCLTKMIIGFCICHPLGRLANGEIARTATKIALNRDIIDFSIVISRKHTHNKSRRAITTLRSACGNHCGLDGMEFPVGDAFYRNHFSPHQGTEWNQTAIHSLIMGFSVGPLTDHHNRAGSTIPIATAFFGSHITVLT